MAEKVHTASIIARKSQVDMEICCGGAADLLDPSEAVGAGGVGDGAVTAGAADDAILGSSVSSAGWSTAMSSVKS